MNASSNHNNIEVTGAVVVGPNRQELSRYCFVLFIISWISLFHILLVSRNCFIASDQCSSLIVELWIKRFVVCSRISQLLTTFEIPKLLFAPSSEAMTALATAGGQPLAVDMSLRPIQILLLCGAALSIVAVDALLARLAKHNKQ